MKVNNKKTSHTWTDQSLTSELPSLLSKGENQFLDFKKELGRKERLAKEIASFATSNDGMILIGVNDDGQVCGIDDGFNQPVRKELVENIEKICSGCIKPSVTPDFKFAIKDGKVILAINITKGPEPVYYTNSNVPYLRNHSQARPAEPNEVYQLVKVHIEKISSNNSAEDPNVTFASNLIDIIHNVQKIIDQSEYRCLIPWVDEWKNYLGYHASDLRDIASTSAAVENDMVDDILELADRCESVSNHVDHLNSGISRNEVLKELEDYLTNFIQKHLSQVSLNPNNYNVIDSAILQALNQLEILIKRTDKLIEQCDTDGLKESASKIGKNLLEFLYYDLDEHLGGYQNELKKIGIELNVIETIRIHSDARYCMKEIKKTIIDCKDRLAAILSILEK